MIRGLSQRMRRQPIAALAMLWLTGLVVLGFLAPWLAPASPAVQNPAEILLPPNAQHWLGTDDLGRDVLSRLIYGSPVALTASLLAVSVAALIGVPLGLLAGFAGGWIDMLIGRIVDAMLSFPAIILAVGITGALGAGLIDGMIAVGVVFAPVLARLARAETRLVRAEPYVEAARGFGASTVYLLRRHILPNVAEPLIIQITLLLAQALLAEASLSFLGLGAQPPAPSWGAMLARAYAYMEIAPEQMYAPGLAIVFTSLAFNRLGEALRAALDPRENPSGDFIDANPATTVLPDQRV